MRSPSSIVGPPAQGFSARKISPHNFCQQNPAGIDQCKKLLESQAVPLKEPTMDLLRLTPFELQHWGSSLKDTSGIQIGTGVSGIKAGAGSLLRPAVACFRGFRKL